MVFNRHCLWRLNPAGTSALLRWTKRSYGRVCRGGLGFSVLWLIVAAGLPSLKDAMADPTQVPAATQETDVPEVNLSGDTSAQWAIVIVALASIFLTAYFFNCVLSRAEAGFVTYPLKTALLAQCSGSFQVLIE